MQPKPIKRSKHLLQLSKDHHFTLLFCWKIREGLKKGVDAERIKKYVQYFWQKDMQDHFREEEEILFVPVQDERVQKAIRDHKQIKQQVEQLKTISLNEEANAQLAVLADTVDAHVRFEERELFPHLEQLSTEAQMQTIAARLKTTSAPADEYADAFWEKTGK